MWAQEAVSNASFPAAGAIAAIGATIFVLGWRLAVARRAFTDWRATKAAVPKMRKGFFTTAKAAAKFVFWVLVALALLVSWVVHDVRS